MRVLLGASDDGGCGHYRMIYPYNALKAQGYDVTLDVGVKTIDCVWDGKANVVDVDPCDYDVVVIQRPLSSHLVQAIPFLQRNGVAVVIELDDDFWSIDPSNVAFADSDPKQSPRRNHEWLTKACQMADLVTVSTPALGHAVTRAAAPARTRLLRNLIPESYLSTEVNPEAPWHMFEDRKVVGWTGSPRTHRIDLKVVNDGGVMRACRDTGALFFAIGSPITAAYLGFEGGDSHDSAWSAWISPIENYPSAIKGLDVGIVPLAITQFNQAKSYLKGLEYSSLGIPFVASPTNEYKYLCDLGAGDLAKNSHDWFRMVKRLLVDSSYRDERAAQGFVVAANLTYEQHAVKWWDAWTLAREIFEKEHG